MARRVDMNPPARYGLDSKKHHFAGGSASEFSELSGEGEIYSPPLSSRDFWIVDFSVRMGSCWPTVLAISENCQKSLPLQSSSRSASRESSLWSPTTKFEYSATIEIEPQELSGWRDELSGEKTSGFEQTNKNCLRKK
jgi:hypothetical protein